MKRTGFAIITVLLIAAQVASGLIGDVPAIRAIATGRHSFLDPNACWLAMIGQAADGSYHLLVRTINRSTGMQQGSELRVALPPGVMPVQLIFSSMFLPDNVLILDSALGIHQFPLAIDANGSPKLAGPPISHPPLADPNAVGAGTAIAEAPNAADPKHPFLAVGTGGGNIIFGDDQGFICPLHTLLGKGAISGLAAIPQVGYFAFAAATGGHVVGVNPNNPANPVMFDLADPRPDPFTDVSGIELHATDPPLSQPAPVSIVAANGTRQVAVLQIPAQPGFGGFMSVGLIVIGQCPIAQVEVGSLVMLDADGGAVTYDPGFTLQTGGSGHILTLVGATLDLDPDTLNLISKGQYLTANLEVEGGHAAQIVPGTIVLTDGVRSVPISAGFAPQLEDADGDGIADLTVKFDRSAIIDMLRFHSGERFVTLRALWSFTDGSTGHAGAQIRIIE